MATVSTLYVLGCSKFGLTSLIVYASPIPTLLPCAAAYRTSRVDQTFIVYLIFASFDFGTFSLVLVRGIRIWIPSNSHSGVNHVEGYQTMSVPQVVIDSSPNVFLQGVRISVTAKSWSYFTEMVSIYTVLRLAWRAHLTANDQAWCIFLFWLVGLFPLVLEQLSSYYRH